MDEILQQLKAIRTARLVYSHTDGPLIGDTILMIRAIDLVRDELYHNRISYEDARALFKSVLND